MKTSYIKILSTLLLRELNRLCRVFFILSIFFFSAFLIFPLKLVSVALSVIIFIIGVLFIGIGTSLFFSFRLRELDLFFKFLSIYTTMMGLGISISMIFFIQIILTPDLENFIKMFFNQYYNMFVGVILFEIGFCGCFFAFLNLMSQQQVIQKIGLKISKLRKIFLLVSLGASSLVLDFDGLIKFTIQVLNQIYSLSYSILTVLFLNGLLNVILLFNISVRLSVYSLSSKFRETRQKSTV